MMGDSAILSVRMGPVALFEAEPVAGAMPHTVDFTDLSVGDITSWVWNFGDGHRSSEQNPTHAYVGPGVYTVNLTVEGSDGTDTYTRKDVIRVTPVLVYLPVVNK